MTSSENQSVKPNRIARSAARSQVGMTLLEIMIVLAIIALVMGVLVGPRVLAMFQDSKVDMAKIMVTQVAEKAYPPWSIKNMDKECPESLKDLKRYMNNKDAKDPWGQDLIMVCGPDAPDEITSGFGVISKGPDKKENTDDDIKSW